MKSLLSSAFALLITCVAASAQDKPHAHFTVTLSREAAAGASGRLLIFMSSKPDVPLLPNWERDLHDVWIAAKEVPYLAAGDSVEVDADELAFPEAFSKAPEGEYRFRAVLDTNHTFAYAEEEDDGDLRSGISMQHFPATRIALTLRELVKESAVPTPHADPLDFESRLLSEFWGRPVHIRGFVILPPSYQKNRSQTYPTLYWTHGFGGTLHGIAAYELQYYYPYMERHERPEMINVLLDQSCPFGTHEFANSANNGPWGDALVKELIPALEKKYRMDRKSSGRLLQGHSSGGWAALWLQVRYPSVFGGTWPTAPDPPDFHAFIPVDLTSARNFYRDPDGKRNVILRPNGKEVTTEDYAHREMVLGEYGGQLSSFEAVFSPRGRDGRPMLLFNRATGEIDAEVARAWEKYDIARILRENWRTLGPQLNGKIHLYVGTADEYSLNQPAQLLQQTVQELGGTAEFVFLPGRTHHDLYDGGTAERMWQEMINTARPGKK